MGSKRVGVLFGAIAFALLSLSGAILYGSASNATKQPIDIGTNVAKEVAPKTSFDVGAQLITEPQDGMAPVEHLIESASSSIDVVMYEFDDTQLEQLLIDKAKEGVAVRVILDNGYFGAGSAVNEEAFDRLRTGGVQVHWSPVYFALTHEKSLVVDGTTALIMTFNFSPQYYKSDRDFGILDNDEADVTAIKAVFDADWKGQNSQASNGDDLVWSPNSRPQLLTLINSATSSLEIYNEEMQDPQIISALEQAAKRGVNVEVDMTYAANWKSAFDELANTGVHIRTYAANAALYIHAKVIIADGSQAFVGSENFSSTSLDQNRELGVLTRDTSIISSLQKTFTEDWEQAAPWQKGT